MAADMFAKPPVELNGQELLVLALADETGEKRGYVRGYRDGVAAVFEVRTAAFPTRQTYEDRVAADVARMARQASALGTWRGWFPGGPVDWESGDRVAVRGGGDDG